MKYDVMPLTRLIEQFARLPGIGRKTAQRLAFYVLNMPHDKAKEFADTILEAHEKIRPCAVCQNLTDREVCQICSDPARDHSMICVVEGPRDVMAIERTKEYQGLYHVLHGLISPMNQKGPDDLTIRQLLERIQQGGVQEVIMATNPTVEGETTAMYIARLLKPLGLKVTRLGIGHPDGRQSGVCRRGHPLPRTGRQAGIIIPFLLCKIIQNQKGCEETFPHSLLIPFFSSSHQMFIYTVFFSPIPPYFLCLLCKNYIIAGKVEYCLCSLPLYFFKNKCIIIT